MRKAMIVVQGEQFSAGQIKQLDCFVHRHYAEHVSTEKLLTVWNQIPKGQAFTNYKDSRSSIVTMECADGFPQEKRVAMLKALEKDWLSVSGQHPDHLMLALVEEALFAQVFKSSQQRLSSFGKLVFFWKLLGSVLRAKTSASPIVFNPNL